MTTCRYDFGSYDCDHMRKWAGTAAVLSGSVPDAAASARVG